MLNCVDSRELWPFLDSPDVADPYLSSKLGCFTGARVALHAIRIITFLFNFLPGWREVPSALEVLPMERQNPLEARRVDRVKIPLPTQCRLLSKGLAAYFRKTRAVEQKLEFSFFKQVQSDNGARHPKGKRHSASFQTNQDLHFRKRPSDVQVGLGDQWRPARNDPNPHAGKQRNWKFQTGIQHWGHHRHFVESWITQPLCLIG